MTPISPCRRRCSGTGGRLRRDSSGRSVQAAVRQNAADDLGRRDNIVKLPAVGRADIHELDEAQDAASAVEVAGHRDNAVFVDPALDHHVDLDRPEADFLAPPRCRLRTRPTGNATSFMARKTVSSSESRLTVTRFKPASLSACALRRAASRWSSASSRAGQASAASMAINCLDIPAQQRLAAGQAYLLDAQARRRSGPGG